MSPYRIAVVTVLAATVAAGACLAKSSKDLRVPKSADDSIAVIVQYSSKPGDEKSRRVSDRGGKLVRKLAHVDAAVYQVNAAALDDLEKDSDVEFISPDRAVAGTVQTAEYSINAVPYAQYRLNLPTCAMCSMSIAFVDSGIDATHPNFAGYHNSTSRIVYQQSFVGTDPKDLYGHGTHVAGIGAGLDNLSDLAGPNATRLFWSMTPLVNIVSLKALDANGKGTDSAVIAAIDRAIQLKSTYNIRVLNLSLGRPVMESYKSDPLCRAVERAWQAGIVDRKSVV